MSKVVKVVSGGVLGLISPKYAKLAQAAVLIGAGIATGNPALILAGVSRAASALAKTPKSQLGQLDRLNASINPGAYRPMVLGSTAMATDIRYVEPSGTDQEYIDYIVGVACHRVDSIDEIWFEDRLAWSDGGGVDSFYSGYLTIAVRREGASDDTIAINGGAKWGSTCRLTGCAYIHIRLKRTGNSKKAQSPLVNGLPSRLTIIGKGMKLYDPRQDSTVPGGSGSMRANDQATWNFTGIGDNAALQILGRLIGWRINGLLSVGDGVPIARIDMPSFITAANLCDEAVTKAVGGTEPRYQAAVVATEGDEPQQAYAVLLAACNGRFRDSGGKLSLSIMHNDLAPLAADPGLDDNDVLGAFTWDPHPALPDSFNIVRGKYTDATTNGLYQQVDYPEVKITSIDGRDRVLPLDLIAVESPSQAQRIVKQVLQRRQYAGRFTATFSNRAWKYQVGDPVPFTFSACEFVDKPFRVAEQMIAYDGTCPMVLTVEDDAIYAWDADESPEVQAAAPEKFDPENSPYILGIAEAYDLAEVANAAASDAASDAVAAQAAADAALADLADIASDGLLTPDEKPRVIYDRDIITNEQSGIDTQATNFGITTEKTAYDNAVSALTSYLATLTTPVLWSSLAGNTTIVGATFRTQFADVYAARQVLLNKIAAVAKSRADQGVSDAAAAQATANTASSNATTALNEINAIVADGVLDKSEKPAVVADWNTLSGEQAGIDAQATAFAITTEKTAYDNAITALATYLSGLSPAWYDYGTDTNITRVTFISKFTDAYGARQTLLNKIAAVAKARADLGVSDAATAQSAANAAQSTANTAASNASSALTQIGAIVADGILDKSEKPSVKADYDLLIAEQPGIDGQATAYSITTEKTAYDNAVSALTSYLTGLSPAYSDYTTDTAITRATFISKFQDAYTARQTLLNKIAAVAGTLAGWNGVTSKPANIDALTGSEPIQNTLVQVGANRVVNSSFARGTYGFIAGGATTNNGVAAGSGINVAGYYGQRQVMTGSVVTAGWTDPTDYYDPWVSRGAWLGGTADDVIKFGMPVKPGDVVYARCLAAQHRCTFRMFLLVFDETGSLKEAPNWDTGQVNGGADGNPANFNQVGGVYTITNSASRYACVLFRMLPTSAASPVIFFTEPAMGPIPAGQTVLPPYQDGPADPLGDATAEQPIVQYFDPTTGRLTSSLAMTTGQVFGVATNVSVLVTATDQGGGTGSTISIPSHVRKFQGPGGPVSVSYNSGSFTNQPYSTRFLVLATDPDRVGGAVTYVLTQDPADALNPAYVHVTTIDTPGAGNPPLDGSAGNGESRPPSYSHGGANIP